jgi:hypothetical protein
MAEGKYIESSTTDRLPGANGNKEVQRSVLTWVYGFDSIGEAYGSLIDWVRKNGYDAVVGIRFEAHPHISYSHLNLAQEYRANVKWAAYGTAIAW